MTSKKSDDKKRLENQIVFKNNSLNELNPQNISPAEYKLFLAYLAIIRPNKPDTMVARLYFDEYKQLFGIERPSISFMREIGEGIRTKGITIPNAAYTNGATTFNLFEKVITGQDENERWFWELTPTQTAIPYMFKYKGNFSQYQLKSFSQMKTVPEIRLYEILKQALFENENIGNIEINISDLQKQLGTNYSAFKNFKLKILDKCKKTFEESKTSEITFTYVPGKKAGKAGKTYVSLIFTVCRKDPIIIDVPPEPPKEPNKKYIDENGISHIFEPDKDYTEEEVIKYYGNERNAEIAHSTQYEFTKDEIDEIVLLMTDLDIDIAPDDEEIHLVGRSAAEWSKKEKYIRRLYSKLQSSVKRYKVKSDNRARYFIKMLENAIKEMVKISTTSEENPSNKKTSYDLDEWEKFADSYIANYYNKKHETDSTSE